eukprot:TRINITY_DN984_c0_g1_i1.p1 TRINITY_DN984_c0_g1~~TRINITY_DN984_c0_g1_i1.p1  ORF type:complete len:387 (-),score=61.79 TRINITY_DN984_c0_g1_i1:488-1648(-)
MVPYLLENLIQTKSRSSETKYQDIDAQFIASFLSNTTMVTSLDFRQNPGVKYEGAKTISELIMKSIEDGIVKDFGSIPVSKLYCNEGLTKLELMNKNLGDAEVSVLANCLKTNTTVTSLDLRKNEDVTTKSAVELRNALKDNNTTLKTFGTICFSNLEGTLNLKDKELRDLELIVLSHFIKDKTKLKDLDLSLNHFTDVGASFLADGLEGNTTLTKLTLNGAIPLDLFHGQNKDIDLSEIRYKDSDVIVIAAFLKNNTTIEDIKLNLKNSDINKEGAEALAKAVITNQNVKSLTLNGEIDIAKFRDEKTNLLLLEQKDYSDSDAIVIGALLKENTTLTDLALIGNHIKDTGAEAIAEGFKIILSYVNWSFHGMRSAMKEQKRLQKP